MAVLINIPFSSVTSRGVWNSAKRKLFSTTNRNQNHYDIIIAGGGMIGTTLACTLGKNKKLGKKSILLLEGNKDQQYVITPTYSNRVSAVNDNTVKLLTKIGAWKHISATRSAPVKKLQVWDALSDSMITFNSENMSDVVAYIVENDLLIASVGKELKLLPNVTVVNEAKIKNFNLPKQSFQNVEVGLENGTAFTCELLLGCDGANSQVRKAMGTKYLNWNYNQMGLVATLHLSEPTNNIVAWQRFLPTGPIALLPLTDSLSSLVWSTTPAHAKELLQLPPEKFVDAVNDAIWKEHATQYYAQKATKLLDGFLRRLNLPPNSVRQLPPSIKGVDEGSRAAFPLGFGHATNYVARGVALVGDAAHRVHPLAGQGVNLGFGDITCLNDTIGESVYAGSTVGNLRYLKCYESNRQKHNVPTMMAVHGLHKLYNTSFTPLVVLRSLGLQITQALPPLKKAIIAQAAH